MFNMGSLRAAICASHTVNLVKFSNSVGTGGTGTGAGTQVPGTSRTGPLVPTHSYQYVTHEE